MGDWQAACGLVGVTHTQPAVTHKQLVQWGMAKVTDQMQELANRRQTLQRMDR